MSKPILIIGGGPAGLAAAHSLGTVGKSCVLVDKADKLGGAPILSGYAKLVPSGEWAKDAIGSMVKRVEDDSHVQVVTDTSVASFDGEPGNFNVELSNGEKIDAEAAILCSGFTQFDSVNKP
jgi:heterodisulfide reductase subunit A